MKSKNALNVSGGNLAGAEIHVGDRVNVRVSKGSKRPITYPEGCVGANLAKRNYVKYLVERYNQKGVRKGSEMTKGIFGVDCKGKYVKSHP